MKNFTVYMHISPSGKRYIGITQRAPEKRWMNGNGYKHQQFYKAIEKYGWHNIEHRILYTSLSEKEAKKIEVELIKEYNTVYPNGYNVTHGGDGTVGIRNYGSANPNFGNHKIAGKNNSFYGKKHTREVIEILRAKATGVKCSEETKRKMSESRKGMFLGCKNPQYGKIGIDNVNSKKILQYTKNMEFVRNWDSAADVERELKIAHNSIGRCCNGNLRSAGGYIWRHYVE